MSERIKAVVVGMGRWGRNIAGTIANNLPREEIELISVYSQSRLTIDDALTKRPLNYMPNIITGDFDIKRIRETGANTLFLAVPVKYLVGYTVLGVENDFDVFAEKPLAVKVVDIDRIEQRAKEKGRIVGVGYINDYNSAVQKLLEDLKAGVIGDVEDVSALYTSNGPLRVKGDVLSEVLVHPISLLPLLLPEQLLQSVSAKGRNVLRQGGGHRGLEEKATVEWDYENLSVTMIGSWIRGLKRQRLELMCSKKHVVYDGFAVYGDSRKPRARLRYSDSRKEIEEGKAQGDETFVDQTFSNVEPLEAELRHFAECCNKREEPKTGLTRVREVTKLLELAYKSFPEGEVVDVLSTN